MLKYVYMSNTTPEVVDLNERFLYPSNTFDVEELMIDIYPLYGTLQSPGATKERNYPNHAMEVLHTLSRWIEPSPQLEAAVLLHDFAPHLMMQQPDRSPEIQRQLIETLMPHRNLEFGNDAIIYIDSVIQSAESFETIAEESVRKRYEQSTVPHVKEVMADRSLVPHPSLQGQVFTLGKLSKFKEQMEQMNIEGMLLKCAEVIANIQKPNKDRPGSTWLDAQEALAFYAPVLDLLGQQVASTELRDVALQHLYRDETRILELAGKYREKAEPVPGLIHEMMFPEFGTEISYGRIKTDGSSAPKYKHKYRELAALGWPLPDLVASRIVVEDESMLFDRVEKLLKIVDGTFGMKLMHPNGDKPIEWTLRNIPPPATYTHAVDIKKRKTGFQSVNINTIFGGIPVEFQVMTREMYLHSRTGPSSHLFYKDDGTHDIQNIDELLRRRWKQMHLIQDIDQRSEHVTQSLEHPHPTLASLLLRIETFPEDEAVFPGASQFGVIRHQNADSAIITGTLAPRELVEVYDSGSLDVHSRHAEFLDGVISPVHISLEDFQAACQKFLHVGEEKPLIGYPDEDYVIRGDNLKKHHQLLADALSLATALHANLPRRTGGNMLENHVLPVAYSYMLSSLSHRTFEWETLITLVLHDFIEDSYDQPNKEKLMGQYEAFISSDTARQYLNTDRIEKLIDLYTKIPGKENDSDVIARVEVIRDSDLELFKIWLNTKLPFDRMNNLTNDFLAYRKLQSDTSKEAALQRRKIISYYQSTLKLFGEYYASIDMAPRHKQSFQILKSLCDEAYNTSL